MKNIFDFLFSDRKRTLITFAAILVIVIAVVLAFVLSPSPSNDETVSSDVTSSEVTSSEETVSEVTSSEEITSSEETVSSETTSSQAPKPPVYTHTVKQDNGISIAKVDKDKLNYYKKSVNADTIGWLSIPNTNIDFAVVQSSQSNPHYYSTRDYYKNYTAKGASIWADAWCTFGSKSNLKNNTILYGHNWTNCWRPTRIGYSGDKWFAQLAAYDNLSFAQQNPYISFSLNGEPMFWQIFAVSYVKEDWEYTSGKTYIDENANPSTLANQAKRRSIFNFDTPVGAGDKILTLSTCTRVYGKRDDIRFVVFAKLINQTENLPAVTVTKNQNYLPPV